MSLPRQEQSNRIADQLNQLAAVIKTRSRAGLTDGNQILEPIAKRLFNALFGWNLINLNAEQANFPAADLGDRAQRIAIQVTNEDSSAKITYTAAKAVAHNLGKDFDRLIIFFLLPKKPGLPRQFSPPDNGPEIVTWDIADLLTQLKELDDLAALTRAADILNEELGRLPTAPTVVAAPEIALAHFDVIKYAPAELLGREAELALLTDAWGNVQSQQTPRPHVLAFVALGGEGKTSLVAKWAAELAANDWPGCEAVFAWSFYSQGTREQNAASSDAFLNEALAFFGETEMAASAAGAHEKGQRLARVVGQKRALLILDGLEPLQYAPTSPTPGELKDQGLAALLKGLATGNRGLCVITTRYAIPDLNNFLGKTVHETRLQRLATAAGAALLKHLGVRGSERKTMPTENPRWNEYEQLVEDVQGHALTLNLLGTYLRDAHNGDIRRRDRIKLSEANAEEQGGHAFRVMDAYVQSLADGGQTDADAAKGRRA
ncbi:MAG: ATP-binding protein, partial [Acidobacteria bacterium]|nr:ATP-binding protein [Acidobacteriota bacterium]